MGSCGATKRKHIIVASNSMELSREISVSPSHFVLESSRKFSELYSIGKKLGGGAYGEVHICSNRQTGICRAVKIIRKYDLELSERERLLGEVHILKMLDHPNIVRLYEVYHDSKRYYLVTELCTGGELFDRLAGEKTFSERRAARIMQQVLSALAYCHSNKIVHRDMKPENLLLATPDKDARIKVIDFGTSQVFNTGKKMTAKIGTPLYIAPEVLRNSYTEKCDVWSCGIMLYVLLSGVQPFMGATCFEVMQKIKLGSYTMKGRRWDSVSTPAKDLVKNMLLFDPDKRYSALEALNHPWITSFLEDKVSTESTKVLLNDLRSFSAQHKLQQAALTYIVSQLVTSKEKELLQNVFLKLDKDKDGRLGQQELIEGYKEIFGENYPAEEEVKNVLSKIDIDNNGYIDLTEFIMATINKKKVLSQERLIAAFKMFDRDGSGTISAEEIKAILGTEADISDEQWKQVVGEVDENGDGEVSLQEFIAMMQKLLDPN